MEEARDKMVVYKYVFSEPWRYVPKVEPNMITHVKLVDEVLEQEIAQLHNYIERRHLSAAMQKAMNGQTWRWRDFDEKAKYRNPLKDKPLHQLLGIVADETVFDSG